MEPARKLQHREIAKEEKTKGIRGAFTKLFEQKELMRIISPSVMAHPGATRDNFFECIDEMLGHQIKAIALANAKWQAFRMVTTLEEAAERVGVELEIADLSIEDCMKISCFDDFIRVSVIPKFLALKVVDSDGMVATPIIFSPDLFLMQSREGTFIGSYDEKIEFADVFRELEFIYP